MFITFPSFNAALAPDIAQFRVAINTIIAIVTSCVFAFLASRTFWGGQFHMLDIQHATLAGGIGVASATAQCISPGGACVVGAAAGLLSAVGYAYITPFIERRFGIVDEAGVISGHGLPGLLGGIATILGVAVATSNNHIYGQNVDYLFPHGSRQAGYQAACLGITIGIALVGAIITGLILLIFGWGARRIAHRLRLDSYYSDAAWWLVPYDFDRTILSGFEPTSTERELVVTRA